MNEERLTILRMISEKKITIDEGERLMDALGDEAQPSPKAEPKTGTAESFKKWTFDFGNLKKDTHSAKFIFKKAGDDPAGVKPSFIKEMRDLGFDNLTVEQLVEMKLHGVTPDFIREMRDLKFDNLTPDQLTEMKLHGVTPDFVREVRQQGFENLTADQITRMKLHGVN